jgi:argininosuccinate lyase
VLIPLIATMQLHPERMRSATDKGFLAATEIADYLARKAVPFRQAHGTVRQIVEYCIRDRKTLSELSLAEFRKFSPRFDADIHSYLAPERIADTKRSEGGTALSSVRAQIKKLKKTGGV